VNIKQINIWRLKLPFTMPIKHNLANHEFSHNLVVKVTTGDGLSGYGEGIPRDFVTGETLAGSLAFLNEVLLPAILPLSFESPQDLLDNLSGVFSQTQAWNYPAACCALETALLDAAGKTWDKMLVELLGPQRQEKLFYSAVLPMVPLKKMAVFLQQVKHHQMKFLKLKVGNGDDLAILQMARQALGWEIDIRVDANGAWEATEAIHKIKEMAAYKISAVEQPVAKEDWSGLKKVSEAADVPIIADESICTLEDAQRLIDLQACQIFNLRLSKCGGLSQAAKIRQKATKAGIQCQLGCHVGETSILAAAGRHFALGARNLVFLEGSMAPLYLSQDPVTHSVIFQEKGQAGSLNGPGLGIQVRERLLDELSII